MDHLIAVTTVAACSNFNDWVGQLGLDEIDSRKRMYLLHVSCMAFKLRYYFKYYRKG